LPQDFPLPAVNQPAVFLPLYNGKILSDEEVREPGHLGVWWPYHEHDPVADPPDICAELLTVRGRRVARPIYALLGEAAILLPGRLLYWEQRSRPFVISGSAIRDALAHDQGSSPSPP
jgi:hypothetical protein